MVVVAPPPTSIKAFIDVVVTVAVAIRVAVGGIEVVVMVAESMDMMLIVAGSMH
jgi:hypothetical protein